MHDNDRAVHTIHGLHVVCTRKPFSTSQVVSWDGCSFVSFAWQIEWTQWKVCIFYASFRNHEKAHKLDFSTLVSFGKLVGFFISKQSRKSPRLQATFHKAQKRSNCMMWFDRRCDFVKTSWFTDVVFKKWVAPKLGGCSGLCKMGDSDILRSG